MHSLAWTTHLTDLISRSAAHPLQVLAKVRWLDIAAVDEQTPSGLYDLGGCYWNWLGGPVPMKPPQSPPESRPLGNW
jgi:hypothetical protein